MWSHSSRLHCPPCSYNHQKVMKYHLEVEKKDCLQLMKLAKWNCLAKISLKLYKLYFSALMWWYWQRYPLLVRNLIGWWRSYDSNQTACFLRSVSETEMNLCTNFLTFC